MTLLLEVVEPHVEFITPKYNSLWDQQALKLIEECGRVSHKSEGHMKPGSAVPFIQKVAINWGHESILEHVNFTVCFIGSRAMSHQLVRHRIAAYTQESQRYCDYAPDALGIDEQVPIAKGNILKIIIPPSISILPIGTIIHCHDDEVFITPPNKETTTLQNQHGAVAKYLWSIHQAYESYCTLQELSIPGEDARFVLPNATKTEVYTTFNLRVWRHFFRMRLDKHAQWEIRQCAKQVYNYFKLHLPIITEKLETHSGDPL